MSERTASEQAAVDFLFLLSRGSVSRELLSTDRKRWHRELRARAREHHRTIETGNHGMIAWAVIGYEIGDRHTAAVAYRDR